MDGRARLIAAWCRQAKDSGALTGDLCYVQMMALDLLEILRVSNDNQSLKNDIDLMRGIFNDWLAVEHHDVYEAIQKEKAAQEEEDSFIDISEVEAEDMMSLIRKMRQANMDMNAHR